MALGFRDCCNSASYFLLEGIPGSVSQNEVYEIITLEGPIFCATYTTIPVLNYLPPTYNLIEMTMQDNSSGNGCQNCIANNPCPIVQNIQLSQFGPGSIAVGTDCDIRTMYPMSVSCDITNPTFDGFADGTVRLIVTGGTYPYTFFSAGTNPPVYFGNANPDPNVPAPPNNTYIIVSNADEGVYNITTVDAQGDYVINTSCVLDSPPAPLEVVVTTSPVSLIGECDGSLSISINGGTPPYTILVNSIPVNSTTLTDLCAGDYEIVVIDAGEFPNQQIVTTNVNIGVPPPVDYPPNLCFSVGEICSTTFNLDFQLQVGVLYNLRAVYSCTNPQVLGLTTLLLRWEENVIIGATSYNGWGIGLPFQISNGAVSFNAQCGISPLNSFVRFIKTDPESILPLGNYTTDTGFLSGLIGVMAQGTCAELAGPGDGGGGGGGGGGDGDGNNGGGNGPLTFTFQVIASPCGQQFGSVVIVAQGGSPPYTYYVNNTAYVSPVISLAPGAYTLYVGDSLAQTTNTVPFTITELPPAPINMTFNSYISEGGNEFNYYESNAQNSINYCQPCDNIISTAEMREFLYPIDVDMTVTGLGPGQVVEGYFIVTLKLQNVFSQSFPSCVSIAPSGNLGGFEDIFGLVATSIFTYENNSYDTTTPISTNTGILIPRNSTNINVNLLNNSQNTGCFGSTPLTDSQILDIFDSNDCNIDDSVPTEQDLIPILQAQWNSTNIQTKQYTVNAAGDPITFFNGTGKFRFYVRGRFRPANENCPPAKGFQWEIQFFRTDPDIVCTTFNYNGAVYVPGGNQKYIGSIKQVGPQEFPNIITNTQIIN